MVDRPIILRESQLKSARAAKRTHICLPAWFAAGRRTSVVNPQSMARPEGALRLPTPWQSLQPGDRLWVQEEFCELIDSQVMMNSKCLYRADLLGGRPFIPGRGVKGIRYRVNNYDAKRLPREGSRYTLVVKAVRVFPCQDITWEEIKAEGGVLYPSDSRPQAWNRNYGILFPWDVNLEVVGLTFEFLAESIDGVPAAPHEREPVVNVRLAELLAPVKRGDNREPLDVLEEKSTDASG